VQKHFAQSLSNVCAKNSINWIMLIRVTAKSVGDRFLKRLYIFSVRCNIYISRLLVLALGNGEPTKESKDEEMM